ncbi:hypothetical protein CAPTEDRAFT_211330 [Capitella teleta]|uniref:Ig-like domain-containing protein n=1 Tax=Capitella teleta TaxID=283909 RepID=R7URH9_CAPTE|nr:hypothetical protein CAPTEDRAFT_211330 [Capitella teleta]|eukprot:ELU06517.1 hypothetical protein CAPTEDRAFT_211330 [Capitella teleta]
MVSFKVLLLISVCVHSGHTQVFESTPGLVKVHEGDDADLIWTTREEIYPWAEPEFFHTSVGFLNNRLVEVIFGFVIIRNECYDRCVLLNGTHSSGIRIPNITTADAKSKYIIVLPYHGQNDDAVIYVYQKPKKPQLTSDPDDVEEGDYLRLTCTSSSSSLPEGNRSDVTMNYKWAINNQYVDSRDLPDRHSFVGANHKMLMISGILREDFGFSYKCISQENGSRLQSDASEFYVLDFSYAPGGVSIQGESVVVAGDDVTFACSAEDHGNPLGIFKWKNPHGGRAFGATLTIDNLTVDDDDGDYECYVENYVAQGASAIHTLSVNGTPSVEQDLDSEKSVFNTDESFSVSCAFRAKPTASVVWKRKDDSALPSNVFSTSSTEKSDGKFTITTSTLTWSGTNADARRGKGGKMFCEADNGIRDPVQSNTMDLAIQCMYLPCNNLSFGLIKSGFITRCSKLADSNTRR